MKYPKNRKNNRGVSIIEIVVSMVLIMLVMLVLAFVYPNGRKVTESTDKRTKATEIAKSIMEEIQLIPLFPRAVGNTANASLSDFSLVRISGENTLNQLIAQPGWMANLNWPYHQLSVGWDATTPKANNPVCPFFITTNANAQRDCIANPSRPFFLCTDSNGAIPVGISVTPNGDLGNARINQTNPIIATVTVNVAWGNFVNAENANNRWHFSYISLVNTRTENIY